MQLWIFLLAVFVKSCMVEADEAHLSVAPLGPIPVLYPNHSDSHTTYSLSSSATLATNNYCG